MFLRLAIGAFFAASAALSAFSCATRFFVMFSQYLAIPIINNGTSTIVDKKPNALLQVLAMLINLLFGPNFAYIFCIADALVKSKAFNVLSSIASNTFFKSSIDASFSGLPRIVSTFARKPLSIFFIRSKPFNNSSSAAFNSFFKSSIDTSFSGLPRIVSTSVRKPLSILNTFLALPSLFSKKSTKPTILSL